MDEVANVSQNQSMLALKGLGVHLAWFGEVVLGEQEGPWTWVRQEQGSSLLSCYFQAM